MKITRRKALQFLGLSAIAPATLLASPNEHTHRRSRFEMIFAAPPMQQPHHKPLPHTWPNDTLTMAWLGHSTILINFFGTIILTDPILTNKIGIELFGLLKIGPQRLVASPLQYNEIPRPHIILLSHAHMDHLDLETLRMFPKDIHYITAKHTSDVLENLSLQYVTELDWNESIESNGVFIEALRVKHFGWRYPWEEDRSRGNWYGRSFNAYILKKNNITLLIGGDTAYHEYFKTVADRIGKVTCALMPIGAYNPWIRNHCTPEQAVIMAEHLNAQYFFPMHWATFIQSDEPTNEPIERLLKVLSSSSMSLGWKEHGETWTLPKHIATMSLTDEEKDSILVNALDSKK